MAQPSSCCSTLPESESPTWISPGADLPPAYHLAWLRDPVAPAIPGWVLCNACLDSRHGSGPRSHAGVALLPGRYCRLVARSHPEPQALALRGHRLRLRPWRRYLLGDGLVAH